MQKAFIHHRIRAFTNKHVFILSVDDETGHTADKHIHRYTVKVSDRMFKYLTTLHSQGSYWGIYTTDWNDSTREKDETLPKSLKSELKRLDLIREAYELLA
jgi:hypothetical protein